jgi:hypothetical protein
LNVSELSYTAAPSEQEALVCKNDGGDFGAHDWAHDAFSSCSSRFCHMLTITPNMSAQSQMRASNPPEQRNTNAETLLIDLGFFKTDARLDQALDRELLCILYL